MKSAENGASGIVPSTAEMWALAQQIMRRTDTTITKSSGNNSRPTRETRSSHGSEQELQRVCTEQEKGITKTVEWETAVGQRDLEAGAWFEVSDERWMGAVTERGSERVSERRPSHLSFRSLMNRE